jgi:Ca2+-binding EF-hand superfamily protein
LASGGSGGRSPGYSRAGEISPPAKGSAKREQEQADLDNKIKHLSTSLSRPQLENFEHSIDKYLLEHILVPYLQNVYQGLLNRSNKDYLSVNKTREYLNMPFLISARVCNLINANGDERIDSDEFVLFFLRLLMGSQAQRMKIAFRIYDADNDQTIGKEEIRIVLKNIPRQTESNYGISVGKNQEVHNSRLDLLDLKQEDDA